MNQRNQEKPNKDTRQKPDMSLIIEKVRDAFNVDLPQLPLGVDNQHIKNVQGVIQNLPNKNIRLLILSNAERKMHQHAVLSFLNSIHTASCDLIHYGSEDRGRPPHFPNITSIKTFEDAKRRVKTSGEPYDIIISFDSNEMLSLACSTLDAPGIHIGRLSWNIQNTSKWRRALRYLPRPPRGQSFDVYNTLGDTYGALDFQRGLNNHPINIRKQINFPPHVPTHYLPPKDKVFPFLVIGGGDRDYSLLHQCRHAFDKRVLVVAANVRRNEGFSQKHALFRLKSNQRFVCLPYIWDELYWRCLLHSKVVVLPFRGKVRGDYTVISDALWYGKPILTTRVQANAHLDDRLTFFSDAHSLRRELLRLEDDAFYKEPSQRVMEIARQKHNLLDLLTQMYLNLPTRNSAPSMR